MKTSRISRLFVTAMLLLVGVTAMGQDNYREALKDYINLSQNQMAEKMQAQIHQLNPMFFEYKQDLDFDQLANRYINERFGVFMADMLQDQFKENITESDLRKMTAMLTTPQGNAFREHTDTWSAQFEQVYENGDIGQSLNAMMEGKPVAPIVRNSDIPESYAQKFMQYFDANRYVDKMNAVVNGVVNQMSAMMGGELPDSVTSKIDLATSKLLEWNQTNMGTLAMNSAYGIMTEADLDFFATLYAQDSYRHALDASSKMSENVMKTGFTIILDYVDWMKTQGVPLSRMGEGSVESLKEAIANME